jgi:multiple antibiotic resistance protein
MIHGAVPRSATVTGHHQRVDSLNVADTFVTFLALLGPQKMLVSFARTVQALDVRSSRTVAVVAALLAAAVGAACALAAPWIATFFHFGTAAVALAAGLVFFVYAVGLVLGFHLGESDEAQDPDAEHPLTSGLRQLMLPFVVSPLAIAAALEYSLASHSWAGRWTVAGAFAAVAVVDAAIAFVFAPLLRRAHVISLEIVSRLLGVMLAAVGVQLVLTGLVALGVHVKTGGH